MGKSIYFSLLAIVTISVVDLRVTDACSCNPFRKNHPQTEICKSPHAALVVEIIKQTINTEAEWLTYTARIKKILKKPTNETLALEIKPKSMIEIQTPFFESLCGVTDLYNPKEKSLWLISGPINNRSIEVTLCDTHTPWKLKYHLDCEKCSISTNPEDKYNKNVCVWDDSHTIQEKYCQQRYGFCRMGRNKCKWDHTLEYDKCIGISTKPDQNSASKAHKANKPFPREKKTFSRNSNTVRPSIKSGRNKNGSLNSCSSASPTLTRTSSSSYARISLRSDLSIRTPATASLRMLYREIVFDRI